MESVDRVTGQMGETEPAVDTATEAASREPPAEPEAPAEVAAAGTVTEPSTGPDPWATLVDAGLKLVESLTAPRSGEGRAAPAALEPWLETDPQTGRTYLKLPAPAPETLQRLAGALATLLGGLRQP